VINLIKILHYGLSNNRGGIETYLQKLYTNIDKSKYHFSFINHYGEDIYYYKGFKELGATFYDVVPRNKSIIRNKITLRQLFKNNHFDILHCHMNTLSYIEPILAALNNNCKVIIHSRSSNATNKIITKSLHMINSLLLPKEKIKKLAVSDEAGKWLFGKKSSYTVINNAVDTNKFRFNSKIRKKIRKKLGLKNKFVLGHVGTFLPVKNHSFIIDVFYELKKLKSDSKLLLIGDGYLKSEIVSKVEKLNLTKNIKFLGERENVNEILLAMDFFIFPSTFEGFGNALVEAQATGLPSLVSETISDEAIVLDSCKKMSLSKKPWEWAKFISQSNISCQRNLAYKSIQMAGLSIETEIKKIENVYYSLVNNQ